MVDLLAHGDIKDELAVGEGLEGQARNRACNAQQYRNLGPLRNIPISDACPLCRLIFSIFPTDLGADALDTEYVLRPMPTYNRLGRVVSWGTLMKRSNASTLSRFRSTQ